jgi:hypothetical protein
MGSSLSFFPGSVLHAGANRSSFDPFSERGKTDWSNEMSSKEKDAPLGTARLPGEIRERVSCSVKLI